MAAPQTTTSFGHRQDAVYRQNDHAPAAYVKRVDADDRRHRRDRDHDGDRDDWRGNRRVYRNYGYYPNYNNGYYYSPYTYQGYYSPYNGYYSPYSVNPYYGSSPSYGYSNRRAWEHREQERREHERHERREHERD